LAEWKGRHTPGAEALAYLEAKDTAAEEGAEGVRRRQNVPQRLKPHREGSNLRAR
jgi:hypothetical protein